MNCLLHSVLLGCSAVLCFRFVFFYHLQISAKWALFLISVVSSELLNIVVGTQSRWGKQFQRKTEALTIQPLRGL